MKHKRICITLVVLEVFVALGAIAGGIGLLTGAIPASLSGLQGSPFVDYSERARKPRVFKPGMNGCSVWG